MPLAPPVFPAPHPVLTPAPGTPTLPTLALPRVDTPLSLCEVRVDVPLSRDASPAAWERAWRRTLAKSRLTGLASGGANVVSVRVRMCNVAGTNADALALFLPTRLQALPGNPIVQIDSPVYDGDWRGVRVWLSFASDALPALLRRPKKPFNPFVKGRRP